MKSSVAFDNGVYELPLIYGNEDGIILQEDKKYYYEISNSSTWSALGIERRTVRVILGRFGTVVRNIAPYQKSFRWNDRKGIASSGCLKRNSMGKQVAHPTDY